MLFYGKILTFLCKGAIFSLIFQSFFGAWPEFRPKIRAGPSFSPKNRAGPTARWPAGQAFYQPESPTQPLCALDVFFRQISTFVEDSVAFVFGLRSFNQ